ncbi:MAG: hypothetical protein A2Z32_04810, partial [Chloroflexi bacterium RBG_16_69_14]
GLRGVAILLVLLFHAALIGIPGGFIGVDVFFVISGFLITGLLIRERERTGGIRLQAFYARRVRRLLPAGMVALAVTLVASFAMLSPLDRSGAAVDGAAAALSIGNIRFALAAGDYFASVESPSPFLHFWSLAVEEQFYLVWPALVLAATCWRRPRLGAGLALGIVLVASLAANVIVTDVAANWAFYSLPTRAWQLALGGLLVLGTQPLQRIPPPVAAVTGWAGLAVLIWAAFSIDGSLAYPGLWALAPTLAAAAMIVSGMTRHGPAVLLATSPLRFLGRISYSLYLWHWPILVLPVAMMEGELPLEARVALTGFAILVAWTSWRFIEEPFRAGFPVLARRPGRTILAGVTAVALVVSTAGGLASAGSSGAWDAADVTPAMEAEMDLDAEPIEVDPSDPAQTGDPGNDTPASDPPDTDDPDVPPETPWPTDTPTPDATPSPTPRTYVRLPSDVRPTLAKARTDEERLRRDGCLAFEGATRPRDCVYGDKGAAFTVALVGDSHAAQWFPALERVARTRGWRILTFVKVACPFVDMRVRNISLKREYGECAAYNDATIARLREARPDITIVSMSRFAIHPVFERDATVAAQAAALARMLERIPGRAAVLVDTPDGGRDIPACLSRHVADVRACAIARKVAFARSLGAIERAATQATGATLIDLTSRVCRAEPCPVVVDGMIVFRDIRHLTATFSRSLAPDLERQLATILDVAAAPAVRRLL